MDMIEISVARSEERVKDAVKVIDNLPSEQIGNYLRMLATSESMRYSTPQARRLIEKAESIDGLAAKCSTEINIIKQIFGLSNDE